MYFCGEVLSIFKWSSVLVFELFDSLSSLSERTYDWVDQQAVYVR